MQEDLDELESLLLIATRPTVRQHIEVRINDLKADIASLQDDKRLGKFSWDQKDDFVK